MANSTGYSSEDPGSIPRTHSAAHKCLLPPVSDEPTPSSGFHGDQAPEWCTDIYTGETHIYFSFFNQSWFRDMVQ